MYMKIKSYASKNKHFTWNILIDLSSNQILGQISCGVQNYLYGAMMIGQQCVIPSSIDLFLKCVEMMLKKQQKKQIADGLWVIINLQQQIHSSYKLVSFSMQVEFDKESQNQANDNASPRTHRAIRSKSQTPPKVGFKGITLKEYFRLCEEKTLAHQIDELDGESQGSDQAVQTPTFGVNEDTNPPFQTRNKIKTEVDDLDEMDHTKLQARNPFNNKAIIGQKTSHQLQFRPLVQVHLHNATRSPDQGFVKNPERKKVGSIPTKSTKDFMNRSTLSSFYNIQKNKKKMLNKLKTDKDRINDLKLSDAFSITKYATRFRIDEKLIK